MKRGKWTTRTATGTALAALLASGASAVAQTAASAPPDSHAPMVKPPEAASGAGGSSNPDNMPIKRPSKPTNDRMSHEPPASGANAK
ncbi:Spy/CpxP family protein refolding chaperone [Paraburkholderia sp. WC7.3g]|uniref:Uncharacterized protein n=1 Tax=Paraburkholderia podalyriae TaxID=1938811 RepID=A0ABR7PSX1_9BURK|nr:hypothetical protein [Paraburkholderia podalyriae]MBC8749346.1 hypothetical protein [Paraburkholderia podalyriae]